MYEEVAMDFKYWEDASDAFRCGDKLWLLDVHEQRLSLSHFSPNHLQHLNGDRYQSTGQDED